MDDGDFGDAHLRIQAPSLAAACSATEAALATRPKRGRIGERRPIEQGDLPFLVKRDGTWLYRGSPINRKELVCLFSSVLRRDEEGSYWLETPAERGRIEVEDTPWLAVELDWHGIGVNQVLSFRTNVDQVIVAGDDHPLRIEHDKSHCAPRPYIHVRDGSGMIPIEARIARPVYYELAALAEPGMSCGRPCYGVWSCGRFFRIGDVLPDDA